MSNYRCGLPNTLLNTLDIKLREQGEGWRGRGRKNMATTLLSSLDAFFFFSFFFKGNNETSLRITKRRSVNEGNKFSLCTFFLPHTLEKKVFLLFLNNKL